MKRTKKGQLEDIISNLPKGAVFAIADFTDVAEPKTISKMLSRMAKAGEVEKLIRSVYWKKGEIEPKPDEIAQALARENNWECAPSGYTALHLMGLEKDVPDVWTYVTSGTYRKYTCGNILIQFTHTDWKFLATMSQKTKLLVQCVKAYGAEHLNDERMKALVRKCKDFNWTKIKTETKNITRWVSESILRLCGLNDALVAKNGGIITK